MSHFSFLLGASVSSKASRTRLLSGRGVPRDCSIVRVIAFCMCAPLLLLPLQQSATANLVGVDLLAPSVDPTCTVVGTSANMSATCSGLGNTAILAGTAANGSLTANVTVSEASGVGAIPAGVVDTFFQQPVTFGTTFSCSTNPGASACGTFNVQLEWQVNGTYSYSGATLARIDLTNILEVNNQKVLDNTSLGFDYCPSASPTCSPETGSGSIADTLTSAAFNAHVGPSYLLYGEFDLNVQCGSVPVFDAVSCNGDFGDPVLTDILITDPTTGLPVSGITLTGDDGFVYPVNFSSTPEPSSVGLLAFVLIAVGILSRRPSRSSPPAINLQAARNPG
jgi:hypothetical protein